MNAGQLMILFADIIALLKARGILLPTGAFDQTKLDTVQEDAELAAAIAALLEQHGVNVPDRVEKIIAILPLFAGLIR